MAERVDLAVVGGGIAGLAAAWTAARAGHSVRLLERAPVVGGKLRSERVDGYLIEHGPHSFLGSASALWRLLSELGLSGHAVAAQPPSWRFVHRGGRTRRLPTGPVSAVFGDWLSARGKLRALAEPFVPAGGSADEDLLSFMRRRFGAEVAEGLVSPFVTGIYAGDAGAIGARDAFPTLVDLEQAHASVIRGALARRRGGAKKTEDGGQPRRRGLFSLRDGMATLPSALADQLGERVVQTGAEVVALERAPAGEGWTLRWRAVGRGGRPRRLDARAVVLATPPAAAAGLLADQSPEAVARLGRARTCPMAMVHIGGPVGPGAPRGFGALIPRGEGVRALGMLLPTSLFPGRAPAGHATTAVFFGGAQDPDAAALPEDDLIGLAVEARRKVFGAHFDTGGDVAFSRVIRWSEAIVQYETGHRARMAEAVAALGRDAPGLRLAGAHIDGVSMNDAAASGIAAADALLGGAA